MTEITAQQPQAQQLGNLSLAELQAGIGRTIETEEKGQKFGGKLVSFKVNRYGVDTVTVEEPGHGKVVWLGSWRRATFVD